MPSKKTTLALLMASTLATTAPVAAPSAVDANVGLPTVQTAQPNQSADTTPLPDIPADAELEKREDGKMCGVSYCDYNPEGNCHVS